MFIASSFDESHQVVSPEWDTKDIFSRRLHLWHVQTDHHVSLQKWLLFKKGHGYRVKPILPHDVAQRGGTLRTACSLWVSLLKRALISIDSLERNPPMGRLGSRGAVPLEVPKREAEVIILSQNRPSPPTKSQRRCSSWERGQQKHKLIRC